MNILHICSSYSQQQLFQNYFKFLASYVERQSVYVPVRSEDELGKFFIKSESINIYYSLILKKYHRILFNLKIKDIYNDLLKRVHPNSFDLVHAHYLFSNGAVALKLKMNFGIPYIVTIRNTDINIFFKFMPHLRRIAYKIIKEASYVHFITPSYINILLDKYSVREKIPEIEQKIKVIPNGVHDYWLDNIVNVKNKEKNIIRLLYVGDFSPNKNVLGVIKAVDILKKQNINIHLSLVGGTKDRHNRITKEIEKRISDHLTYYGRINDKKKLKEIYMSNDIFIMTSFTETFGIVYLEAMSQGLPIIYSEGQGIDRYFESGVIGYSVNPYNTKDIAEKILLAHDKFDILSQNCIHKVPDFSWEKIVKQYLDIYNDILNREI